MLFLDVMVKKTQILIEHIKNHHLGLSLTENIVENTAVVKMYDNFITVNSQLLHITNSNHWYILSYIFVCVNNYCSLPT